MSQISNNDRKSSPHWDPLKAGDDLEEQWYFYRSNQYFVFQPRDSCYLPSSFFYGFYFSFLFLVYVCHAIITWQINFFRAKDYDENAQTPIFFYECCKTKYKSGDIADVTFKQFSFLDQSSPYFLISLFIIWQHPQAIQSESLLLIYYPNRQHGPILPAWDRPLWSRARKQVPNFWTMSAMDSQKAAVHNELWRAFFPSSWDKF